MYKLWIIDTADNTSKYDDFFGQFSISFYASLESAIKVNKMTGSSVPDGLLVSQPKDIEYAMKSFSSSLIIRIDNQDQHVDSVLYIDGVCALKSYQINKAIFEFQNEVNDYFICLDKLVLKILSQDVELKLSHKEALILKSLFESKNDSVCRIELSKLLWGDIKVSDRTLDSHISRLRKRLRPMGVNIESVYGSGYRVSLET